MGEKTERHLVRGGACRRERVEDSFTPAFNVLKGVVYGLRMVLKCDAVTGKTPGDWKGTGLLQ